MTDVLDTLRSDLVKLNTALVEEKKRAGEVKQFKEHRLFQKIIEEGFNDKFLKQAIFSDLIKEERDEVITAVQVLDSYLAGYGQRVRNIEDEIAKRQSYIDSMQESM